MTRRSLLAVALLVVGFVAGSLTTTAAEPRPGPSFYVVEQADGARGWYGIAEKLDMSPQAFVAANCDAAALNTTKCPLFPGRILMYYPPEVTPSTSTTSTTTTVPPTTSDAVTTTSPPPTTSSTTAPTSPSSTSTSTTTATSAPTTTAPAAGVLWSENFATAAALDRLVFDVHNDGTWPLRSFGGDHNHDCAGPTTYRPLVEQRDDVDGVSDMIWWCAPTGDGASGHFMTGMNTEGYTIIAFSPRGDDGAARIFPATANRICWDQNVTDLGGRKWTQLAVVSDDTFLANGRRLPYRNPDFSDVAGETTLSIGPDGFLFNNLRNSTEFFKGDTGVVVDEFGLPGVTDKAARYRHCVRDNGNGTVTRTQTRPGGQVHTITGPGSFPAGPRVFILEDDTYNADKDYDGPAITNPYTWHWDNIEITAN